MKYAIYQRSDGRLVSGPYHTRKKAATDCQQINSSDGPNSVIIISFKNEALIPQCI